MAKNSVTEEECQAMIHKSFRTPMVRFLRERLEKAGCAVGDNFFKAVTCDEEMAGAYVRREGVKVCSNYVRIQDDVNMVVIRELIHIRTNHLSGSCHYKRELLKGFLKIRGHGQECVKRKVMQALSQNPNCSGLAAKDAMEAVWDA
ncbi:Mitochondrial inner membrane protease ATP23 [Glycine soja]